MLVKKGLVVFKILFKAIKKKKKRGCQEKETLVQENRIAGSDYIRGWGAGGNL